METGTGLTILGSALGSAKLIEKILGPTSEYIGIGIRDWTEKRVHNIKRIFESAEKKLGDQINQNGSVPPRVLKGILDEGSFCEDELAAEYFGGVLASSRSTISRDDRGASFIALISRLTTYQIRTHYIFYQTIRDLYCDQSISVMTREGRVEMTTFIPMDAYEVAMDYSEAEDPNVLASHNIFGLRREDLIYERFAFGEIEALEKYSPYAKEAGLWFQPSVLGAEFFLWAYGKGQVHPESILDGSLQLTPIENICTSFIAQRVNKNQFVAP